MRDMCDSIAGMLLVDDSRCDNSHVHVRPSREQCPHRPVALVHFVGQGREELAKATFRVGVIATVHWIIVLR